MKLQKTLGDSICKSKSCIAHPENRTHQEQRVTLLRSRKHSALKQPSKWAREDNSMYSSTDRLSSRVKEACCQSFSASRGQRTKKCLKRSVRRLTDAIKILSQTSLNFNDLLPHLRSNLDTLLTRFDFCVADDFANVVVQEVDHFGKLSRLARR